MLGSDAPRPTRAPPRRGRIRRRPSDRRFDVAPSVKADLEILTSLAKRRGFAYPSAEIYGGFQSTWDYGPLGVEMKRQNPGALVALDGAVPRRCRRHRGGGDHQPRRVARVRPRRPLHGSAGRLPRVSRPHARRPHRGRRVPLLRRGGALHGGAELQLALPHLRGAGGGGVVHRLPAPGDGAGDVRQLRQRADVHPAPAAAGDRADRPVLPQRDHTGTVHLPYARVRADGDGVLLRSLGVARVAPVLERGAAALVPGGARRARRVPPPPRPRVRGAGALLRGDGGCRVPLPVGMG